MTQIAQTQNPSIVTGPRGVGARNVGGTYTQDGQQDILDADAFQGPLIILTGTTDIISPIAPGNYIVKSGSADAMTLALPRVGLDDNLSISIYTDTAFAHTLTLPSAAFAVGTATPKTIGTWTTGFRGQGITLRAYNGTWQVVANNNVAFT